MTLKTKDKLIRQEHNRIISNTTAMFNKNMVRFNSPYMFFQLSLPILNLK